jgi:glycosyltransferase involved in cell wall biosynthesis
MKVLYIGPYKDGTGWAHAAIENILALDAAGVDVVCRPLKLNEVNGEVSPKILELETKSDKGCDVVIQNCLPHQTDYNGYFSKNIAYYFTETSHFKNSSWAERLNLLDEAWVPCRSVVESSINSHVTIPIAVVPVPANIEKYQKEYKPLDIPHLKDRFCFYTIGEVNRRKNLVALLKAYHLEFGPNEPVELVIKGSLPGLPPIEVDKHIGEICNTVKDQLKLYKKKEIYLKETIITQPLTEEQIMQLHATCQCYVSPSYGEGWNMPAFDAMAMGKTPICTNQGGPVDFLINGGWLVPCQPEPVFGMKDGTFQDIYVGNEEWYSINITELRKTMRTAFEDHIEREKRAAVGIERAYDFSHSRIGQIMRDLLDGKEQAILYDRSSQIRKEHCFKTMV